jgi:hypothetical protein
LGKGFHFKTHNFGKVSIVVGIFVGKNHKFCFDIPHFILLFWISFQQNMEFCYNFDLVFNKEKEV